MKCSPQGAATASAYAAPADHPDGRAATSGPPPCLPVSMLRRALLTACVVLAAFAPAAPAAPHVPREGLVRYTPGSTPAARPAGARAAGLAGPRAVGPGTDLLRVRGGGTVVAAIAGVRRNPAERLPHPQYLAHAP